MIKSHAFGYVDNASMCYAINDLFPFCMCLGTHAHTGAFGHYSCVFDLAWEGP